MRESLSIILAYLVKVGGWCFFLSLILMPEMILAQTSPQNGSKVIIIQGEDINAYSSSPSTIVVHTQPSSLQSNSVDVKKLNELDPNDIGLLSETQNGLGPTMWDGSDLHLVETLFSMLSAVPHSPAITDLEIRLLLSKASAPKAYENSQSYNELRLSRLLDMGRVNEASQLITMIPRPSLTPKMKRFAIELSLLKDDSQNACSTVTNDQEEYGDHIFHQKLELFCDLQKNNTTMLDLHLDVLREQNIQDALFFAAIDQIRGINHPIKDNDWKTINPLSYAAIKKAGITIPETISTPSSSLLWPLLAGTSESRLQLAEKSEALGLISTEDLKNFYDHVPSTTQEIAAISSNQDSPKTARSRALFYKAALSQTINPLSQANIIARALTVASGQINFFSVARLYESLLMNLSPNPEFNSFAPVIAKALLATNQCDSAYQWILLLSSKQNSLTYLPLQLALQWSANSSQINRPALLTEWLKIQGNSSVNKKFTATLMAITNGLGAKMNQSDMMALLEGGMIPSSKNAQLGLQMTLLHNQTSSSKALASLLAIVALQDITQADPLDINLSFASLLHVGLDQEAHSIAREIILINGL
jgi:hypothetical protein